MTPLAPLTVREVRARLEAERLPVPPEDALAAALAGAGAGAPWYVRALAGAGGWVAAAFLAAGFALLFRLQHRATFGAAGLVACAAATASRRVARGPFAAQLALAVSLAGQALLADAVLGGPWPPTPARFLALAGIEVVLVAAFADPVHRLLSTVLAAAFGFGAAWAADSTAAFPVAAGAALLAVWTARGRAFRPPLADLRRPVGYGLALAFAAAFLWPAVEAAGGVASAQRVTADRTAAAGTAAVALGIAGTRAFARLRVPFSTGPGTIALLGGAAVVALGTEAPGVPGALALVALAVEAREPLLFALGAAAGASYLGWWYYDLSTTLLVKSGVLAASGLLLLALRWAALRRRAA